jgi:hypothetical protein
MAEDLRKVEVERTDRTRRQSSQGHSIPLLRDRRVVMQNVERSALSVKTDDEQTFYVDIN